jgi:hypothetical protein
METTEFSWSRKPKSWPEINSRPKIINWYSWGFEAGSTPRKVCLAFNLDEIQMVSEMVSEIQEMGIFMERFMWFSKFGGNIRSCPAKTNTPQWIRLPELEHTEGRCKLDHSGVSPINVVEAAEGRFFSEMSGAPSMNI